jgi:glycosyltransferase involved in cell wall biosynthesis
VTVGGPATITWTFLAPAGTRPTGGDLARFELANALARLAAGPVRVVHLSTERARIRRLSDIPWFAFDDAVEHQLDAPFDPDEIPDSDVVVFSPNVLSAALRSGAVTTGRRLVDALQGQPPRRWLPVLLLQGFGVFEPPVEALALRLPGGKVCVGAWLEAVATGAGVPPGALLHLPNGVDPERFRLRRPIEGRAPRVAMNYDPYSVKGGLVGLDAIEHLHHRLAVPATVFGTVPLDRDLGSGLDHLRSPSQDTLARQVYSEASIFLQPSLREGFGMCAVESMACGCALVTTSNGGSDDYAIDGETALVCGGDATQMEEAMGRLVLDDGLRTRIATNGARFVERFRWPTNAARLSEFVVEQRGDREQGPWGDPVDLDAVLRDLHGEAGEVSR